MVLIIDSLDQLTNDNLDFLDGIKPHPKSKIIVSTLPDEIDPESGEIVYWYGCHTKLASDNVPRISVDKLDATEIEVILKQLLCLEKINLTTEQFAYAVKQICKEPTALHLCIAFRVVVTWTSFSEFHNDLPGSVVGQIEQIYENTEKLFGPKLTQSTLCYLTFSKGGMSNRELEDILSLDSEVLKEVFQYSDPGDDCIHPGPVTT